MNTFKLTLLAVSCAAFLSACSSSSGGTDNSEQIRQTETTLTKKLIELNQQVKNAQSQVQSAQAKYDEARKRSDASEEEVVKLNQEVANLKKAHAELALAQAEQSKASDQDIQKLKVDLEQANQAVDSANKAADELNNKVAQEQKAREETARRLKELESLNADERARIPLSPVAFGGIDGVMKDNISGINLSLEDGKETISIPTLTPHYKAIVVSDEDGVRTQNLSSPDRSFYTYLGKSSNQILSTMNFSDVAFGIYYTNPYNTETSSKLIYVQGNPTDVSQIPVTGEITYKGGLAYMKDGAKADEVTDGGLSATANFDKKTISIDVEKRERGGEVLVPEMHFGGKITGNSFAGEVNGIKTQGGFFGEGAKELSGVFTNEADKSRGVYGATSKEINEEEYWY